MESSRRLRRVLITPKLFFEFITSYSGRLARISGIPPGSEFRGFGHDVVANSMMIFIEHESFDEVPLGYEIPVLYIQVSYEILEAN